MATAQVEDPFTGEQVDVSIPDGATVEKVKQSYRTGVWGRDKKVEVKSDDGRMFAVTFN